MLSGLVSNTDEYAPGPYGTIARNTPIGNRQGRFKQIAKHAFLVA